MSFLTAEWRKLVFFNYEIDPKILQPYVPHRTELDFWQGKCYVSLVGFMFMNTKVLGVKIPFHVNFEEVNLRFYVKHQTDGEWKRGTVFLKEIVPKAAISLIANNFYGEHYVSRKMRHIWKETEQNRHVEYEWKEGKQWQSFWVEAAKSGSLIEPGGEAEFITEHYWGYTKINDRKTSEYEVTHPIWEQYVVHDHGTAVDFGKVYGNEFFFLNDLSPSSVLLAEGSAITVENKNNIR